MNEQYWAIQIMASAAESLKTNENLNISVGLIVELLKEYSAEQGVRQNCNSKKEKIDEYGEPVFLGLQALRDLR